MREPQLSAIRWRNLTGGLFTTRLGLVDRMRDDWIYKVNDRYESYIYTVTMQPLKFFRDVKEGVRKKVETVNFNRSNNTATNETGTYKVPACVQDVLSTIYYARNVDFDKYKKGDKIPFQMFLENEVYDLYIRYFGKEEVKTKSGKFNAIKFKVLLIPGRYSREARIWWFG